MNIYEQLNKINDEESLSEKYNVKSAKELKNLEESLDNPYNKNLFYYEIRYLNPRCFVKTSGFQSFDSQENKMGLFNKLTMLLGSKDLNCFPILVVGGTNLNLPEWSMKFNTPEELRKNILSVKKQLSLDPSYDYSEPRTSIGSSDVVYYLGWYDTESSFSGDEPMFDPLYAIDTPEDFPTVKENFANLLKQILKGNKDYSEYVSYPFIVKEATGGNEEEIKTRADLLRVIEEIERGDWE